MTNKYLPMHTDLEKDPWQELFEANKGYKNSKWKGYLGFFRMFFSQKSNTLIMIYKTQLFINLIPKQLLFPLIILTLLISTGSVAQAIAPNEYKPTNLISNLFSVNKQKDKDPYTALQPDVDNEVGFLEGCDLAVKYPKKIDSKVATTLEIYNSDSSSDSKNSVIQSLTIGPNFSKETQNLDAAEIASYSYGVIHCYNSSSLNYEQFMQDKNKDSSFVKISKEKLLELTGWFITQADLTEVYRYDNDAPYLTVYLTYKEKLYMFNFELESRKHLYIDLATGNETVNTTKSGIYANQIQIQFNSVVKSQQSVDFNLDMFKKKESENKINDRIESEAAKKQMVQETKIQKNLPKLVADEKTKIYEFKDCNLQIKVLKNVDLELETNLAPVYYQSSVTISQAGGPASIINCSKAPTSVWEKLISDIKKLSGEEKEASLTEVKSKNELPLFSKQSLEFISNEVFISKPFSVSKADPFSSTDPTVELPVIKPSENFGFLASNGYGYGVNIVDPIIIEIAFLGN